MNSTKLSKIFRILFALALFAGLALALPQHAQAATPFITITAVKAGESATVHATGLPAGMTFVARMGTADTNATNGTVVGEAKAGPDGTFDVTFAIPAALRSNASIAIRIDAIRGGWYAYNWFANQNRGTISGTPVPTTTTIPPSPTATPSSGSTSGSGALMSIQVIAVEKNQRITVSAAGFPANVEFNIRVGPYYTFGAVQQSVAVVNSGQGGSFKFNVTLPELVKDVSLVTIRLDGYKGSTHYVSYNAFTNEDKGTVNADPSASTPGPTPTPVTNPVSTQAYCQILSVVPTASMPTGWDFDAVWEVKNISTQAWDVHVVDYRYQSGEKLHKTAEPYDLPATVKPGETVKLLVDMLAPAKTGIFSTTFVLTGDQGTLCTLPLTITVK